MKKKKLMFDLLFLLYAVCLIWITVIRNGICFNSLFTNGDLHIIPFVGLYNILKNNIFTFCYLFIGNILWFVPLGLYLKYRTCLDIGVITFLGFLTSLAIEFFQYMFGTGVTETDDLILNTVGTLTGVILMTIIEKRKRQS